MIIRLAVISHIGLNRKVIKITGEKNDKKKKDDSSKNFIEETQPT